jgi:hypothetical protein
MQHKLLVKYLTALEQTLDDCKSVDVEQYFNDVVASEKPSLLEVIAEAQEVMN